MALEGVMIDNYNNGANHVFTVSTTGFPSADLLTFTQQMNKNNQHVILGLASGVAKDTNFNYYNDLMTQKAFVQSTVNTGAPVTGL